MSRIGRLPVPVPAGVDVTIDGQDVTVKGPKGTLSRTISEPLSVTRQEDGSILVTRPDDERRSRSLHGLSRTLINNMVIGVTEGYSKQLEIVGTGYRVAAKGQGIELSLGFSHTVTVEPPEGITFTVDGNLKITVEALPVFLGALLLGPVDGMVIGGIGTLLYQLLSYGVTATTALWIAPYVLLGLCVGAVSARHGYACTPRQLALLAVLGELGITVLNTGSLYIDSLIYGYYSPVFVFGTLPLRLAICAGKGIVLALLLPTLLRITRRALQPRAN